MKAVDSEQAQACREVCCAALDTLVTWACLGPGPPGCSFNPPNQYGGNNSSSSVNKSIVRAENVHMGGFARLHEDDPASLSVFALLAECLLLSPEGLPQSSAPSSSSSSSHSANSLTASGVADAQPLCVFDLCHAARAAVNQLAWRYGGYPRFNFLAAYGSVALLQPGLAVSPQHQQEQERVKQQLLQASSTSLSPFSAVLTSASARAAAEIVVCAGPSEASPSVVSASHLPSFSKELLTSLNSTATREVAPAALGGGGGGGGSSTAPTPSSSPPSDRLNGTTQASALVFRDAFGASTWVVAEHDCALSPAQTNPNDASSSAGKVSTIGGEEEVQGEGAEDACPRLYVPPPPPTAQALAHAAEMAAWECPPMVPPTPQNLLDDLLDDFTDEVGTVY